MDRLKYPECNDELIMELWLSQYHMPMLIAALELDFFEILNGSPSDIEKLSLALNLDITATQAMTTVFCGLKLIEIIDGKFTLTDISRVYLLKQSVYYWGDMIALFKETPPTFQHVLEALKGSNGEQTKNVEMVTDNWEDSSLMSKEWVVKFTKAMHSHSLMGAVMLAKKMALLTGSRFLDVGGGSGCFSIALAQQNPSVKFTIADLPLVCETAKEYVKKYGLTAQVDTLNIDMFKSPLPKGYDTVFLSNILHDWNEAQRNELLSKIKQSLGRGKKIMIYEALINNDYSGPLAAGLLTTKMMIWTKGKQFTGTELTKMLEGNGFSDVSIQPVHSCYFLITASS
ncbi:methyltransferase [Erwinia psidii]|uniref:Methyltransferase n=1 Tax=Erwinia psidii TaxID=69224 RepID=A0A3N6RY63_9GAMM|nr:methyltransferase [Erwinia psidii]MCX8958191.1 methyltransferase [Erwinia psidii]MCX8963130.1 methyltransferase [Erwinia psidii]MCX8966928.1 methyltransferase [Erwinia psidii]RQM38078.1 methyltransferase [Erwinia psidii]